MARLTEPIDSHTETIAAVSTPPGEGGIGVVRLSGPDAVSLALRLFRRADGTSLADPQPFRAYVGHIVDSATGRVVDEVLLTTMRAPRSYTREDVAEISAHGGPAPLRAILALVLDAGARLAAPGEFTRRAFLSGRLDLTQAEAVLDVIRAHTDAGLRAAERALAGDLGTRVRALRDRLTGLLAHLEAAIDFADDDLTFLTPDEIAAELAAVAAEVDALIASHARGRVLRDGARTVIVGRPNTGKSSLLNALLGEARAIVTAVPGTTRDVIEEQIELGGVPVRLVDTAGIHATADEVERLGVARSRDALATADLALLVLDASVPLTDDDRALLDAVRDRTAVIVLNKADLPAVVPPAAFDLPAVVLSAHTGAGLPALEATLRDLLLGPAGAAESPALTTLRQREAAETAAAALARARATHAAGGTEELLAVDLVDAAAALGAITGDTVRDEVIETLFARFCVGK
jgi:tRNA modification GTPase